MKQLVDHRGNPIGTAKQVDALKQRLYQARRELVRAKYDAAQTAQGNENHWANADHLDPHTASNPRVRRTLRSRSRYEVLENNPFLKGIILTIANDFVGRGPKLKVIDERLSKARRQIIEQRFWQWSKRIKLRQILWRMRLAKIVDGETFLRAIMNRKSTYPIKLDFKLLEAEQISSEYTTGVLQNQKHFEVDGVRFDNADNPVSYYVLNYHPGNGANLLFNLLSKSGGGKWIDSNFVIHWFRKDRGWWRGIPETTPSLPHCAILRRYTLAMVRWAETQADMTAIIETEGPANQNPFTDSTGQVIDDDPFDTFPIEPGMMMNLPWGYKMKQLNGVPLGVQYDEFVGAILREITRPILVPFNLAVGSSKDSNMASAIVDQNVYKGGQESERYHCEEEVLNAIYRLFWYEAVATPGYLGDDLLFSDPTFRVDPPFNEWGWDRVGLDHTDPSKVANSLKVLHDKKFLTDADIQEGYFNRDVERWRNEIKEDEEFRKQLAPTPEEGNQDNAEQEEETADSEE